MAQDQKLAFPHGPRPLAHATLSWTVVAYPCGECFVRILLQPDVTEWAPQLVTNQMLFDSQPYSFQSHMCMNANPLQNVGLIDKKSMR